MSEENKFDKIRKTFHGEIISNFINFERELRGYHFNLFLAECEEYGLEKPIMDILNQIAKRMRGV